MFFNDVLVCLCVSFFIFFSVIGLSVLVIKSQKKYNDPKEAIEFLVIQSWISLFEILSLPWKMFKGLFFVINGDPNKKRSKFSLTRSVFGIASFIMLFRLVIGGISVEDVNFGPNVTEKTKSNLRTIVKKLRKPKKRVKRKKKKRKIETITQKEDVKVRPWFFAKKVVSQPITLYEILLYLMIILLYYFRRDLATGDDKGMLDKFLEVFGQAYAIKLLGSSPYPQNQNTIPPSIPPLVASQEKNTEVLIKKEVKEDSSVSLEKKENTKKRGEKGRRRRKQRKKIINEDSDPFLKA